MSDNWTNSNLERFTMNQDDGALSYVGTEKILCKVCNKEIIPDDICMPFPSSEHVEGIAHKHCMEPVKDE